MHSDNGDSDGKPGTGLVTRQTFKGVDILTTALRRSAGSAAAESSDDVSRSLPAEVRRVRRGRFFLSRYEQTTFGSIRQPIFAVYCHGVVVGETIDDEERDGIWCYAAHNDFDLIPEFQLPSSWPEYIRTRTGWARADGTPTSLEIESLTRMLQRVSETKRLK